MTEGLAFTDASALLIAVDRTARTNRRKKLYRDYIARLQASGVPVILTPGHLADAIGIDYSVLRSMAFGASLFYQSFSVPKASGGFRRIDAPLPSLATVQRFIHEQILSRLDVSVSASAYVKGRSILDHVKPHARSTSMLRIDVEDFFPSITALRVKQIFESVGYSRRLSNFFAHLLTLHGSLPQGAPSSPLISNLVLNSFDEQMIGFCKENGYIYTRYADDIAISGSQSVAHSAHTYVAGLLASEGFSLNHKKTKYFGKSHASWLLTGLAIGRDGRIRIPKAKRRLIRQQVHFLTRFMRQDLAFPSHHSKRVLSDVLLPDRVLGQLRFWLWVDPNDLVAQSLQGQLVETLKDITQGRSTEGLIEGLIDMPSQSGPPDSDF